MKDKTYSMEIAGLKRELPLCSINDKIDIAAFIIFGDVELTIAAAAELLKKYPFPSVLVQIRVKKTTQINIIQNYVDAVARQEGESI